MKIVRMATSSQYLVVLFCASAGKNGEELGVDEEQIILFVYLLYDVPNNKVIAVQHHYVKPSPNELSETVLTDDCKLETGLQEDVIKNAHQLEHILDEFDRFLSAKGVHPDHGGKSFCLVTDGPNHLRQVLHAECSKKNVSLHTYFHSFYDLRKQFRKFYKTDDVENIKTMLDCSDVYICTGLGEGLEKVVRHPAGLLFNSYAALVVMGDNECPDDTDSRLNQGLQEDQSVEYGVRQCQEMAVVIHRLLVDGFTFGEPEDINERLEPGICSKTDVVDDNSVVRARGLPWQSSDQDIARFFKGLNIAKGGVALCLSPQGRRNGEALVRLQDEEQRDLALKRHKHHIGQRYIEVYKATGKDFVNVAGGSNSEAQAFLSRGGQVIIRMRGLPFTSTTQQVLEFFAREPNPCEVLDGESGILFVHYPDGRSTGDAFVLMATEEEANIALKKHREIMGTRYIELFKSTTAEVQQVLNRSMDPRNPEPQESQLPPLIAQIPPQASLPYIPQNLITSGTRRDCVRIRNLPGGAQVTDILSFLGEFSQFIVYQGVHMVYSAQGEPSGEAFIQMNTEDAAQLTSINRHRRQLVYGGKKRIIDVIQCSGEDMNLVLTHGITTPTLSPVGPMGTHLGNPVATHTPTLSHPAILQRQLISPRPTMIPTVSPVSHNSHFSFPYSHIHQPMQAAQFPPAISPVAPRPAMFPQIIYWYPSPPVSPQGVSYYPTCNVTPAAPSVVVMRGLPFNVSMQDILNFFQGHPEVTPENVQVQYTPEGMPSGDVIVTFPTRMEAERAVAEKNLQQLGSGIVELFVAS